MNQGQIGRCGSVWYTTSSIGSLREALSSRRKVIRKGDNDKKVNNFMRQRKSQSTLPNFTQDLRDEKEIKDHKGNS